MRGKTVIVTGAGSGIGLETADALARQGASLVLIEIDRERGEAAVKHIAQIGLTPQLFVADLSNQTEVRRVAGEILAATPRIDVLINNAGAMFRTRQVTVDGLERTFALNHMGCFLLTNLLLDRIIASAPARIVSVSSGSHRFATLDFDDLQAQKKYSRQGVYNRSKLATILFTRALARRLKGTGVTANCLDPSFVQSRFFESVGGWARLVVAIMPSTRNTTPAEACKTSVYLASAPEVEKVTGAYFVKCRPATPSKAAQDDAVAEQLWAESLRLAGMWKRSFAPNPLEAPGALS